MLEEVDIETSTKFELFDVLDVNMGGELGLDELIGGLMRLRGPISKSDIVAVRLKVRYMTKLIEDVWRKLGCDVDDHDIQIIETRSPVKAMDGNGCADGNGHRTPDEASDREL